MNLTLLNMSNERLHERNELMSENTKQDLHSIEACLFRVPTGKRPVMAQ